VSDQIKHECGIGLVRLLKPLEYYESKYGSALWGLNRMFVLMEKQRNRGQDGAGLVSVKFNVPPGKPYLFRERSNVDSPWGDVFKRIDTIMARLKELFPEREFDAAFLREHFPYAGELLMAHLRYGTHGKNEIEASHPVIRMSDYKHLSLAIAGNFNLTNVDDLFRKLLELGQHPRIMTDTELMLERIAHFLDAQSERLKEEYLKDHHSRSETIKYVSQDLDLATVIQNSAKPWDGGYVFAGVLGNGDLFVVRDPSGIRPCFYFYNDEVLAVASERAALCNVFNMAPADVLELPPATVLTLKGNISEDHIPAPVKITQFTEPRKKLSCSFERIYFSRGNDADIYKERKVLGHLLTPQVVEAVNEEVDNTVFSFIPNTSEVAFLGLVEGVTEWHNGQKEELIRNAFPNINREEMLSLLASGPRVEKAIWKDVKMRTFIADDHSRADLVAHVYDITRGSVREGVDNLVLLDDSIVRGTTLKGSILLMLSRLKPKKIVIASSAPQIRYPDCYGIDMSQIERLVAFQAAISLLRKTGQEGLIDEVYHSILQRSAQNRIEDENLVKRIYDPFTEEEISAEICEIVKPEGFDIPLEIIFQPLSNLPSALPQHLGDWYFSGNYPTPGGNKVVNRAFMNFFEGKNERAYQYGLS
jgi:amidophosphoribosyltransferase